MQVERSNRPETPAVDVLLSIRGEASSTTLPITSAYYLQCTTTGTEDGHRCLLSNHNVFVGVDTIHTGVLCGEQLLQFSRYLSVGMW